MTRPMASNAASFSASDSVGWECTAAPSSATVASRNFAATPSASSSVTDGPTMWMPRISPIFASATTFTNPSRDPSMIALLLGWKLNRPTRTSYPRSLACDSLRPTVATWGMENVGRGTAS